MLHYHVFIHSRFLFSFQCDDWINTLSMKYHFRVNSYLTIQLSLINYSFAIFDFAYYVLL